jgi:hypothetical protein
MKANALRLGLIVTAFFALAGAPDAMAQDQPTFVQLQQVTAALYKPNSGPAPHVGVVVMHREANFMSNIACKEFSKRGFEVLCMNSRFVNNEAAVDWNLIPLDVAQGVKYLKDVRHMSRVVLYGNSGGGVTMSFYQAVAENGPAVCQGPKKIVPCGDDLAGLPKADGIILSDGHSGNPIFRLRSINPSIVEDEQGRITTNSKLDPFDPENGFNPNGASKYSNEFKEKYFKAQAERMSRLTDLALKKWQEIKSGKSFYTDDAPFDIPGFDGARLMSLDPSIRHTTAQPEKLLKNDGSIVSELVPSIAPSRPELAKANRTFHEGSRGGLTVRSFLTSNAIRATSSLDEKDMDLCSTNNSTICMLQNVSVPLLAGAMQASFQNLVQEIEQNYLHAKSKDKDYIVVEGATTGSTPCTTCGGSPDRYSNATKNWFDYAAKWMNTRF